MQIRWVMALALGAMLAGTAAAEDIALQPEQTTETTERASVTARDFMVATAHPLATKAGHDVLAAGGTAADAAVAVQVMIALVEPQSSGLGGGGFLLYYDASTHEITAFDGREVAPQAAAPMAVQRRDRRAQSGGRGWRCSGTRCRGTSQS